MFNLPTFLIVFFIFIIHGHTQTLYRCFNSNFTSNSIFESNLNLLFSTLSINAPGTNGFFNTSIGHTPNDAVYGLFQCRGDSTDGSCRDCVKEATRNIAYQFCPFKKGAIVWYDDCMLRYSDQIFFSVVSIDPNYDMPSVVDIVIERARFNELVMAMLTTIAAKASLAVGEMYATEEAIFSSNTTVYGLGQCTSDLSNTNCHDCLTRAIRGIPSCCTNRIGGRVLFPSCYVRYEVYSFYQLNMSTSLVPPPSALLPNSNTPSGENRFSSGVVVVVIVVPITLSILLFILGCCFLRRKGKNKYTPQNKDTVDDNEISIVESLQFEFKTIDVATNKFSEENKLGEGGFGPVYKGKLDNGQEIAVKRLSKRSLQGSKEFKNEVMLVAKLQHRNLVRLFGFCLEGEEKILIYEYIPNKSLDYFLFDPETQRVLDWSKRYNIIIGIARGILYLHEDSRLRIIHRDLKANNILLDEYMNPKISDFGMAKIIKIDESEGNTSRIVGTYGYMSPEYAMHGNFSTKSDVYGFGVLVLEIISGKKNNNFYMLGLAEDILTYAWKLWKEETPLELLESHFRDNCSRDEVVRCIHIALLCVQEDPSHRPSMASIVLMLNSHSVTLPLPKEPPFFMRV